MSVPPPYPPPPPYAFAPMTHAGPMQPGAVVFVNPSQFVASPQPIFFVQPQPYVTGPVPTVIPSYQPSMVPDRVMSSAPQMIPSPVMSPPLVMNASSSNSSLILVKPIPGGQVMSSSLTGLAASTHSNSTSTRPPTDVSTWGFAVVDQYHPTLQRIPVPPSVVSKTRGLLTYNNDVQMSSTKPCTSAVCLKFTSALSPVSESCPAGESCGGFHVERSYLDAARSVSDPLCCALHNDYFSQEMLKSNCAPMITNQKFTLVLDNRAEVDLIAAQLAMTVGLENLSSRGASGASTKLINMKKQVCRLHVDGKCKWTKDCGHVHLCRELQHFLQQFHYPSLIFLLMTENSSENIKTKIQSEKTLLDFVRSKCVLPLISQLIEAKKDAALAAIVQCGGVVTAEQKSAIGTLGVDVTCVNPTVISSKIASFVNPKCHDEVSDDPLIAIAEAVLATPTKCEDGPLPTFSPAGSVSSTPGIINESSHH